MTDEQQISHGDTHQRFQKKMREEIDAAKQVMAIQQKAKDLWKGKAKKVSNVIESFQHEEEEKFVEQKAKKLSAKF